MMNDLKNSLSEQGVATGNIYIERFVIGASLGHKRDFSVKIANHKSFTFNKQTTLLNAMEEQGITIESECRIGECGQCKVNLVAGSVKPLIDMAYDLKSGEILPCCCVPKSDLLIKL